MTSQNAYGGLLNWDFTDVWGCGRKAGGLSKRDKIFFLAERNKAFGLKSIGSAILQRRKEKRYVAF